MEKDLKSKVCIHIYMLYKMNNIYFRTKNPKLDRKLDSNLRILETDGRGLIGCRVRSINTCWTISIKGIVIVVCLGLH